MRLPDFICVGAQKSGTSWLYEQISKHPQVFMKTKELDYFFRPYDISWYSEHFNGAGNQQLCGDISPNYAAFTSLAEKISTTCPNALILHFLRNPVDRAFSQWKMARHLGNIPREISFIEAFRANLQFMKRRGEYVSIIEEYSRFYPLNERSAIFWYDDIEGKPANLMERVMSFIGVDRNWQSPRLHDIVWPSPEPGVIDPVDALEVHTYYKPFDIQLRSLLDVSRLPWDG